MGQKMKVLLYTIFGLLFISFTGCATITYVADYNISLYKVERSEKASQLYGTSRIDSVSDNSKYKYLFEDSLAKILWLVDSKQIIFSIENKTDQTLEIPWDKAAYVDENGHSHRVMHSGTKYNDRSSVQPPSIIVRKGILEDFVFPTDYVQFVSGYDGANGYWNQQPLITDYEIHQNIVDPNCLVFDDFEKAMKKNIGKTYQILLPMQIDNTVNDYIFIFRIDNVTERIIQ
jgi:hypothetical protein